MAAVKSCAAPFGHAATHAPHPMHGGGVHREIGGFLRDEDLVGVTSGAGGGGDVSAGFDDAVERAAVDHEVADDGERRVRATARP